MEAEHGRCCWIFSLWSPAQKGRVFRALANIESELTDKPREPFVSSCLPSDKPGFEMFWPLAWLLAIQTSVVSNDSSIQSDRFTAGHISVFRPETAEGLYEKCWCIAEVPWKSTQACSKMWSQAGLNPLRNHYKPKGNVQDRMMTPFFQLAKGTASWDWWGRTDLSEFGSLC